MPTYNSKDCPFFVMSLFSFVSIYFLFFIVAIAIIFINAIALIYTCWSFRINIILVSVSPIFKIIPVVVKHSFNIFALWCKVIHLMFLIYYHNKEVDYYRNKYHPQKEETNYNRSVPTLLPPTTSWTTFPNYWIWMRWVL
jgi:hypothetical protein